MRAAAECARRVPGDDRELKALDERIARARPRDRAARTRGRDGAPADDHPRHRPDHGDGADRAGASAGELPQGPRLCRLAWAHAAAAIDRRQAEARCDHTDGRANAAAAADHRRERGRASSEQSAALRADRGSSRCWRASRACWSRSRWPTRRRASSGRCSPSGGVYRAPAVAA